MATLNTAIAESTSKRSRDSSESPKPSPKKPRVTNLTLLETHVHEVFNGVDLSPENTSRSKHFMSVKEESPIALSESTRRIMAFFAQDIPFSKESHERMLDFVATTSLEEFRLYYTERGQDLRMFSIY